MMKFIDNVKDQLNLDILEHLEKSNGDTVPVWQTDRWK